MLVPEVVPLAQFCALFDYTIAWGTKAAKAGMPVQRPERIRKGAPIMVPVTAALRWLLTNAREERPKLSERERLASEQADKVAIENEARRGALIPAAEVEQLLAGMAADISGRLDGLPGRLAHELAGISEPGIVRARLVEEARSVRAGVADWLDRASGAPTRGSEGGDDMAPADQADAGAVGGHEPDIAAG